MRKNSLLLALKSNTGITLVELAMLIVVVGVLATAMSLYVKETVDLWNFVTFRSEIAAQARTTLMRMVRDIRHANSITTANTSSLAFTDINSNSISYSLSGSNLMRGSQIIASNVTILNFAYYNVTNTQLTNVPLSAADRVGVYRITVQLRIVYGGQGITLNSEGYLRNF